MRDGQLGHIATPASGHRLQAGVDWCADNGAYTGTYPGDEKYLAWLSARIPHIDLCAFAAAPDVVADGRATLTRSLPMLQRIRALGYPAALVAQNGMEHLPMPFDAFDVLFLGGTTAWKLGQAAAELAARARCLGKWVHMGRVNSLRRLRYAQAIGCHSAAPSWPTVRTATYPSCCGGSTNSNNPARVPAVIDPGCGGDADRVAHSPSGTGSGSIVNW